MIYDAGPLQESPIKHFAENELVNVRRYGRLAILAPCETTFFTSEKLSGRLVTTSRLEEPPKRSIVTALWTLDSCCGHCLDFFFSISNNFDDR
jgi:hypothetical protein